MIDPRIDLISKYKTHLVEEGLTEELYKWELVEQFQGRPNLDAPNLYNEIKSIKYANLIYHNGQAVMYHLAKDHTEQFRACLKTLFDENKPLIQRLQFYSTETLRLYRELQPDLRRGHHQDERTMATLLAYYNPKKYAFYKDSFYQKYCKLLNLKPAQVGQKYIHYLELINNLIKDHIIPDKELTEMVNAQLPKYAYNDPFYKILAQDILYVILDQDKKDLEPSSLVSDLDPVFQTNKLNVPLPTMQPLNQILFGPPGTGKTYHTITHALEILGVDLLGKSRQERKQLYDKYVSSGQIVFTTFHQSMSYEDFIEGIKPETLNERVVYSVKPGIFKELCNTALTPNQVDFNIAYDGFKKDLSELDGQLLELKTPTGKSFSISLNSNDNLSLHTGPIKSKQGVLTKENLQKQINGEPKFIGWEGYFNGVVNHLKTKYNYIAQASPNSQNFVLIIDEINRGNVSQIFGELITLIEEDKRLDKKEQLEIVLPYSKEKFGVPANLYIIGTMNTADRSVEALDTALRRRFSFIEMPPKYELPELETEVDGYKLKDILFKINQRIEKLLSKDNLIGHSYFIEVKTTEDLRVVFQNKVIPLLQEYFYGDFGKIGLVLGKGFFDLIPGNEENIFADFGDYDSSGLAEKEVYHLVNLQNKNLMPDKKFKDAMNALMK